MPTCRKNPFSRAAAPPPIPVKQAWMQDIIWGRPVFKAPALPNLRPSFGPLPFITTRVTHPVGDEVQA